MKRSWPVTGADIFPTVLKYAGIVSKFPEVDGIDLLDDAGAAETKHRPLFWHYPHYANQGGNPGSVVRLGDYKLIHDLETGRKELYDLSKDIGESQNIYGTNPEVEAQLEDLLNSWLKDHDTKPLLPNPAWNGLETVVDHPIN